MRYYNNFQPKGFGPSKTAMIKARSLTKKYGSRQAISDISFEIKKGDVVGFLGPNGAGKTTTMKILTGCMAPDQGEALLGGIDVFKEPLLAKQKLGYLPEAPPLYHDMTVRAFLSYVARLKLQAKAKIPNLVQQALEKAGLKEVQRRMIGNLSKGFKQRVGLAQALVGNPDILILDEPTVGLDPHQVVEIREILKQLKGGPAVILSSHILSEVQMICDRVIIINKGQVISDGGLYDLSQKMKTKRRLFLRVKKADKGLLSHIKSMKGLISAQQTDQGFELETDRDEGVNEELAKAVISRGLGFLELRERDFDLEDVFVKLTKAN